MVKSNIKQKVQAMTGHCSENPPTLYPQN